METSIRYRVVRIWEDGFDKVKLEEETDDNYQGLYRQTNEFDTEKEAEEFIEKAEYFGPFTILKVYYKSY